MLLDHVWILTVLLYHVWILTILLYHVWILSMLLDPATSISDVNILLSVS